jgi:Predicted membrane protein (DUF2142)
VAARAYRRVPRILTRVHETMTGTTLATVPVGTARPRPGPVLGPRMAFVLALLAFFAMGAGWALALPVNGTYDEREHIVRAYGAADLQIYAHDGAQRVPESLLPGDPECTWMRREPATCQTPAPASHHLVTARTAAAGYNPLYYLPVGVPLLISPDYHGIIAARLVSALLAALALAASAAIAVRLRNRLLVGGLVLAVTPMAMNLAGSVNPNGWEIAVGVLLWCCLLPLLRPPPRGLEARADLPPGAAVPAPGADRGLVALAGVAAVLLMMIRHLGPVLVALAALAALLMARRGTVGALVRRRDVRWAIGAVVAAGALELVWIVTSGVADISPAPGGGVPASLSQALREIATTRVPFYLQQVIGQFSYGETTLPGWGVVGWYVAVAALAVPAALLAGARYRIAVAGLCAGCLAVLAGLELEFLHASGWFSHGRYLMPAGVGVVLSGCFVRRWQVALGPAAGRRLVWFATLVAVPVHLWALAGVMSRFQNGPKVVLNPLRGGWLPAGGPVPALAAELLGLAALVALVWWALRRPDGPPPAPLPGQEAGRRSAGAVAEAGGAGRTGAEVAGNGAVAVEVAGGGRTAAEVAGNVVAAGGGPGAPAPAAG